ncbi:hypothetical protein MMC30_002793 [Trapelia coarctata]|nr:hypothetical protein [Trapelia coarctata]
MAPTPVSHTDLLIVGAGPSGLMAAAWAAQYEISTRIVDKNDAPVTKGRADGLQARTLEIFDSFGLADQVWKKGFHDIEICTWSPDGTGRIQRSQRVLSQKVGISRFSQVCINQGVIEHTFLDFLKVSAGLEVERCVEPETLFLDHSLLNEADSYPITVQVRNVQNSKSFPAMNGANKSGVHVNGDRGYEENNGISRPHGAETGELEIIKAKYLVGCDGAHSWTRRQLGLSLEGEQSNHIWGVMDIIPLTNFPDIRQACTIHSAGCGSILNVPREDRLNRLYIQLSGEGSNFDRSQVTPRSILEAAKKIMHPYTFDFKYCDWWSVYQIGQRICPKFSIGNRIFLAGDAVHTHSPKLGQGMNVSMQDTYNLGWKLGAVASGSAKPDILETYHVERRQIALDLLSADREIARFYTRAQNPASASVDTAADGQLDFKAMRDRMFEFLAGVGITYSPGILVSNPSNGARAEKDAGEHTARPLAANIKLGARLPSFKVLNQAEARPVHMGEILKSDGRWRLIVFAGDLRDTTQFQRVQALGTRLAAPRSILRKYTPPGKPIDAVIELLTVHSGPREAVTLLDLHEIYHPWDEERGWDYWKVFVDDVAHHEGFDDAYGRYGIDRREGCLVVCRPDQHVGYIGQLEDVEAVEGYFAGILVPRV